MVELVSAMHCGVEFLHVKPGKGAAFVRTKLRNYVTGNTVERTFRAGEQVCLVFWSRVSIHLITRILLASFHRSVS